MGNPFIYSKAVSGDDRIKQRSLLDPLTESIKKHQHNLVQAPYGWGKTSLVKESVAQLAEIDHSIVPCWIDCLPFRTEQSLYHGLINKAAQCLADDEPWHQLASRFLQRSSIPFSFRMQEQSFVLELFDIDHHYAEILELLQQMAESQSKHLVVCLDNFQNLDNVNDPAMLSQRIRSVWQHHQNATYCFIARPRDFLTGLFESNPASFLSFGETFQLTKPGTQLFADFVQKKFEGTSKHIEAKQALSIVNHMHAHPYYTQQLAHRIWELSDNKVFGTTIIQGLESMLVQQAILFERILGELSNSQFNFLKALASDIQQGFSKQKVINQYDLGSSANVVKIQRALIKKEVIMQLNYGGYQFQDPAFALWFKWNILK